MNEKRIHRKKDKPPSAQAGAGQGPLILDAGLYLVSTPIGNLGDITFRALDVLKSVLKIYCEDKRKTQILLNAYGIKVSLGSYHEHNAARMRPVITSEIAEGKAVALVSDAGTPLISDPGFKLVRACVEQGHAVIPIPGVSAPMTALSASGLPSDHFFFAGFLPARSSARRRALQEYGAMPATLIFFESPRRLSQTLADMAEILGARQAVVARELTKKFEEFKRADLSALARHYENEPARGEVTLLVAPAEKSGMKEEELAQADLDASLKAALSQMSLRDAVAQVTQNLRLTRADVYARALFLKKSQP